MDTLALGLLITITAAMLLRGFSMRRAGILQYPFLAAAVVAGWFLPQAVKLHDGGTLPDGGYALTILYASAAMLALWAGDGYRSSARGALVEYDARGLTWGALFLSLVGAAAFALILRTPATMTEEGLTTGIVTIYFFFYRAQYFGYALAVLLFLRYRSLFALGIVLFDVFSLSGFILFGGRRGPAVEFVLITACALWFQWRWRSVVPKYVMAVGIAVAALFTASAGSYRSLVESINDPSAGSTGARLPNIDELMSIDWIGGFTKVADDATYEVTNAIYYVASAWAEFSFNWGASYWNYFVFRYVPGQLVGHDIKTALQFDVPDLPAQVFGYTRHIGTTFTGFADSFMAFGPLGIAVFFFMGRLMRFWWDRADRGSIRDQYYYCAVVGTAMEGITHGTEWLFAAVPQVVLFTYLVFHVSTRLSRRYSRVAGAWRVEKRVALHPPGSYKGKSDDLSSGMK